MLDRPRAIEPPGRPIQGYKTPGRPIQGYRTPGRPIQGYRTPGRPIQGRRKLVCILQRSVSRLFRRVTVWSWLGSLLSQELRKEITFFVSVNKALFFSLSSHSLPLRFLEVLFSERGVFFHLTSHQSLSIISQTSSFFFFWTDQSSISWRSTSSVRGLLCVHSQRWFSLCVSSLPASTHAGTDPHVAGMMTSRERMWSCWMLLAERMDQFRPDRLSAGPHSWPRALVEYLTLSVASCLAVKIHSPICMITSELH